MACVLWIDGIEVGTWLCICKGGSSIGILLKIRCKTKCDKTLPARKVYMRNKENMATCTDEFLRFNISNQQSPAKKRYNVTSQHRLQYLCLTLWDVGA